MLMIARLMNLECVITIMLQLSQVPTWKSAPIDSNSLLRKRESKDAKQLKMLRFAVIVSIASGMNALLTSVTRDSHAKLKMNHIASNPTDNSIQEGAVSTKKISSSVYQLLNLMPRTENLFSDASFRTPRIDAPLLRNANGKEKRLFATILLDGLHSKEVFHALSSLKDTAKMVVLRSNSLSMPLHNSTTHLTTAAVVVNRLRKRLNYHLFQSTQMLSTTNVWSKKPTLVTGKLKNTVVPSDPTT